MNSLDSDDKLSAGMLWRRKIKGFLHNLRNEAVNSLREAKMNFSGMLAKMIVPKTQNESNQELDAVFVNNEDPLIGLYEVDPGFSKDDFTRFAVSKLREIIGLIEDKDSLSIAKYERDKTQQIAQKIERYAAEGLGMRFENMDVKLCNPLYFNADESHELLDYYFETYSNVYLIDHTGNVVSGTKDAKIQINWEISFERKKNKELNGAMRTKCIKCGAPVVFIGHGKCPYCGYSMSPYEGGWNIFALSVFDPLG